MTPERREAKRKARYARERSLDGKLAVCHRMMRQRVRGKGTKRPELYAGLPCLSREDFMAWAKSDGEYERLHAEWVAAGYPMTLAPSVDRIRPIEGYVLGNLQWLTHSENSIKARKGF